MEATQETITAWTDEELRTVSADNISDPELLAAVRLEMERRAQGERIRTEAEELYQKTRRQQAQERAEQAAKAQRERYAAELRRDLPLSQGAKAAILGACKLEKPLIESGHSCAAIIFGALRLAVTANREADFLALLADSDFVRDWECQHKNDKTVKAGYRDIFPPQNKRTKT